MNKYSDMTKPEINKAVAVALGHKYLGKTWVHSHDGIYEAIELKGVQSEFNRVILPDYCNNPSDAWPIIIENKISLYSQGSNSELWCACPHFNEDLKFVSANPLKAAMIVFLMMNEVNTLSGSKGE